MTLFDNFYIQDDSVTYGSWEDANSKLKNVINLQIGREFKKVPIMISGDGTKYLVRIKFLIYLALIYL